MHVRSPILRILWAWAVLVCLCLPVAADGPERSWGPARAGLQLSADLAGPVVARRSCRIRAALRNIGSAPVERTGGEEPFAFAIVQQGPKQFFTQRLTVAGETGPLPERMPAGATFPLARFDLGNVTLYRKERSTTFLDAYRQGQQPDQQPAGTLRDVFQPGPVALMLCVVLEAGGRPTLLKSNLLTTTVAPPDFATLSGEQRETFTKQLLEQFNRSAFAARDAHRTAVTIGKPILPALIEAGSQKNRPPFARAWLTVVVADLRDPRAATALEKLLDDPAVRVYVAYHGPKQRDDALDRAILERAKQLDQPRFTSYALLGYLAFRRSASEDLLTLGLGSDDPRVRATSAEQLARVAGATGSIETLVKRLGDPDPRVRAIAARVLGCVQFEALPKPVLEALVQALDHADDLTRRRVCGALCNLTGRDGRYDLEAGAKQKQVVVEGWREWWRGRRNEKTAAGGR